MASRELEYSAWVINYFIILWWYICVFFELLILPVALLSSVACELAPLRIVLLCVFLYLFFIFLLLLWYVYRLQWLCTTEEHFWTLDNATLTWFRTLYPRIQRGHWRYSGTTCWTTTTWTTAGGKGNTAGDVLEYATDWGKGLTALLYQVFCSLMSNPWRIRWTILEPGLVSNETLGTVTSFVWPKHGSRQRSRTPL